ncbi:MAG TPA: fibronectin type III domain-containing protein, partial [Kiritimatiellia bacterium]|nr:fibronectin type III domain-containing protein [Kiritimatiellia bacterium]
MTIVATAAAAVSTTQTVTLTFSGDATKDLDYVVSSETITIPAGETQGTITFTALDDGLREIRETAVLSIASLSSGLVPGAVTNVSVDIRDSYLVEGDVAYMFELADAVGHAFAWPVPPSLDADDPATTSAFELNWNGVTHVNQRITALSLLAGSIKPGPFAPGISALTGMHWFEYSNCITNPVAAATVSELGDMTWLQRLSLWGNTGLTGEIADLFPDGFADFTNLTFLVLGGTALEGAIPADIFAASRETFLNQARFSSLPAHGPATVLRAQLVGNQLGGVVPDWLVNTSVSTQGVIRLDYNMLDVVNTPVGPLDTVNPTWRSTQTVPPTNLHVMAITATNATLAWTPIAYTNHGGHYEVLAATTSGGPYTPLGATTHNGGKNATGLSVGGLLPNTPYHFVVRTFTPAHISSGLGNPANTTDNANDLTSVYSAEVVATTAEAPSLVVTTTNDVVDAFDGQTSLREALAYAATLTGPQIITFSDTDANGAVNFHDGSTRTNTLNGTQLAITSDVTV